MNSFLSSYHINWTLDTGLIAGKRIIAVGIPGGVHPWGVSRRGRGVDRTVGRVAHRGVGRGGRVDGEQGGRGGKVTRGESYKNG